MLYSGLPTINVHYQKQTAKDNVINHTCVLLHISCHDLLSHCLRLLLPNQTLHKT